MTSITTVSMMRPSCSGLAADQETALHDIDAQAKMLNAAIARAVEKGLIVEVSRVSRHHNGNSAWGDQIVAHAQIHA